MSPPIAVDFVDTSPLHSGGPVDDHMQFVYTWMYYASLVVGVLVSLAILYSIFRFRRKHDDEEPRQVHGNSRLEIGWTVVPFLILVALFGITAANMGFISDPPDKHVSVKIVGQRFSWTMYYTGKHKRSTGREVSGLTPPKGLMVPADTPIDVQLTSTDVNHSFYVPALAGQMNAIPGQSNHFWFEARQGKYYGQCTELCGDNHSGMLIEIDAVPKRDFERWIVEQEGK